MSACSSSKSSTGGSNASTSPLGQKAPGGDIGVTNAEIRVAVIADVQTSINPGLFQKSLNAVKAWADIVNQDGGLAGRKVVIDAIDSKHDQNASRNATITACSKDFAIVGTEAITLSDMSDIDNCKNAHGQAIGIPNLAGIVFGALQQCDKSSFAVLGNDPKYCETVKSSNPTHVAQVGDYKWLASRFPDLHGIWVYNSDVPTAKATQLPIFMAGAKQGVSQDGDGFYGSSGGAPQSALTPIVQAIKQHGSTYVNSGVTPPSLVLLRREAQLQGARSVKAWVCSAGCYATYFLDQGSSAVEGTYNTLNTIPFFSEYKSNPALNELVDKVGGVDKLDGNAVSSYVEALLFEDAVKKAVANGGSLTRESLFKVLHNDETSFDVQGIVGKTNVSQHDLSPCFAMAQVKDGKWQRVYPTQEGAFDCKPSNLADAGPVN